MQNYTKHTDSFEAPTRVDVSIYLHSLLTLTRLGVSLELLFPPTDYIESKQSSVQFVVLNEISKSTQCPYDLTT